MKSKLLIALSKGRVLNKELELLERINIRPRKNPIKSRKLVFEINTISKDKLEIELKSTNTKDIESLMQFLNNNI